MDFIKTIYLAVLFIPLIIIFFKLFKVMDFKVAGVITLVIGTIMYYLPWIGILIMAVMLAIYFPLQRKQIIIGAIPVVALTYFIGNLITNDKGNSEEYSKEEFYEDVYEGEYQEDTSDEGTVETSYVQEENDNYESTTQTVAYQEDSTGQLESEQNTNTEELELIEDLVANYGYALVEAINYGDFSIVEPYLQLDSNLYNSQMNLVDNLYSKEISETIYTFDVVNIVKISDFIYEVETFEEVGIESGGNEEYKEFQWIYTVKVIEGEYFLSDIKAVTEN